MVAVAHHQQGHQFGAVPGAIVLHEALAGGLGDDLLDSDGQPLGQPRADEQLGPELVADALRSALPAAHLLQDHPTLVVDLFGIQGGSKGLVAEHQQSFVELLGVGAGQVEHVHGAIKAGAGVEVATEGHADALEVRHQLPGREVLGPVEDHVFEEVGHAALVLNFVQRAGADVQLHGQLARRVVVPAEHPGHSVVQPAAHDAGVAGQRRAGRESQAGEQTASQGREAPRENRVKRHSGHLFKRTSLIQGVHDSRRARIGPKHCHRRCAAGRA